MHRTGAGASDEWARYVAGMTDDDDSGEVIDGPVLLSEISSTALETLEWLAAIHGVTRALEIHAPTRHAELLAWDSSRPTGVPTSAWPGFDEYLPGRRPAALPAA